MHLASRYFGRKQHLTRDFAKVAAADVGYGGLERGSTAARGRFGHFAADNVPYRALERGSSAATLAQEAGVLQGEEAVCQKQDGVEKQLRDER